MFASKDLMFGQQSGGYQISRSVRFRSSASAYFNRTPSSASNRQTWTWSGWVKRGVLGSQQDLFCGDSSTTITEINIGNDDTLKFWQNGTTLARQSTAVFRDPSAWYHIVVVLDTTNATAQNRCRMYVNGVEITTWTTNNTITQNSQFGINTATAHNLGRSTSAVIYFDGYMTEVNFIDGQALTPTSFGAFDAVTGVWNPKKYSGTYGTNGFYLNFSDNSGATATTIGKDSSGNGNNWTPNNISVTAGTTYDSMVDSPTNYGSDTGAGGEVRGDYCTFNPLNATDTTFSNGNLRMVTASPGYGRPQLSTFGIASGQKFYAEFVVTSVGASSDVTIGIDDGSIVPAYYSNSGSASGIPANFRGYRNGGGTYVGSTYTSGSPGISYTNGNTISVAVDRSANQITYYKNGSSVYTQSISSSVDQYYLCVLTFTGSADLTLNAGQTAFSYTAPSGFKALCTQNLPTPTVNNGANYMAATLYTGNGTSQSLVNTVNGISFQPDLVWTKCRSTVNNHGLLDSVRGISRWLGSNTTQAEDYTAGAYVTAFNSNGFSVGIGGVSNENGQTYVGWQWKGGGTAVTNTAGSITSSVSANTTAGFSVVTYTGNGTNGSTIGHGLGVTPKMIIVKSRSIADNWPVYHGSMPNTDAIRLNTTGAAVVAGFWNNTTPGSSVFTVGGGTVSETNTTSATYVAYCFAPIAGYSAFGSYTGNGSSDGPFVYCGFRPRYVLIKASSTGGAGLDWFIHDTSRDPYNQCDNDLEANLSLSENQYGAQLDIVSNGFKIRNSGGGTNTSGATFIYAAFAENPFTLARAR